MKDLKALTPEKDYAEKKDYVVIGDGSAGILAIIELLKSNIPAENILWIGRKFKVGAFGNEWQGVPGNTPVGKYLKVYNEVLKFLGEKYGVERGEFLLDILQENYPCSLRIAAEPLQYITNELRKLVTAIEGSVIRLKYTSLGLELVTKTHFYLAQRAIIAIGAKPKSIPLPPTHSHKALDLQISLDINLLRQYVKQELTTYTRLQFAVVGSSHSAALAIMNLYRIKQEDKLAIDFKQFANKEYKFANGGFFDNTGLKGKVAVFIKDLLATGWKPIIDDIKNLDEFTHIVSAIGLKATDSLDINGVSSAKIPYDPNTGATPIPGVFMAGSGHPRKVLEQGHLVGNVGVTKFPEDFKQSVAAWISPPSPVQIKSSL